MQQRIISIVMLCILCLAGLLLLTLNGCGGLSPDANLEMKKAGSRTFEHVLVIYQENRTPDNLFHGLPNADIANSGVNSLGKRIVLEPITLASRYDLGHEHRDFLAMYDGGKMDGADKISCADCPANGPFK